MQFGKRVSALLLAVCMLLGLVPLAAAEQTPAVGVTLTGNTGAVITCESTVQNAVIDNNDLAIVELRGSQIRVLGKDGAVGVARLTVQTQDGDRVIDIPIGYTTFVFDGDKLTVLEGSDTEYEISGINAAAEEYLVGSADYPLPVSVDADGNKVYESTDLYKLSVAVKKKGGTYVFTGSANDASIQVKKGATAPAVLLLAGLELRSSFTAPVTVKKESASTVTLTALAGWTSTLADAAFNNADLYGDPTEDGGDGTNVEYAESAVIKGKTNANLTLNGEGTLQLQCASKNAVKVGAYGALVIDGPTLEVTSVKNGLSSDNTLEIRSGKLNVTTAEGDCIRSDPDAVDPEAGCAGCITISGGELQLQSASDGIQAAQDLTISGGEFSITTGSGWNDSSFNKDTMSCKGLKASCNSDDTAEDIAATNVLTISGGSFDLNTADDAIHSDGSVVITGGEFSIRTGDDGVHADVQADFGAQGAADCAVELTVTNCYEGLEAGDVTFWSGCYSVTASDDGVNAAGGSSNGSDPGGGGWDPWRPGGGSGSGNTGSYHLYVKGGMLNVNANGDGLDSNGNLELTGGSVIVWGQASGGDNAPLDCDGTLTVKGATVFAAGSRQMAESPSSSSQPYVRFGSSGGGWGGGSSSTIASGRTVNVKNSSSLTVFSILAPKSVNYALYSDPSMTSSSGWSISGDTSTPTVTRFWAEHSYSAYTQTSAPTCTGTGTETAVCQLCGKTLTRTTEPTGHSFTVTTVAPTATAEGYDLYTCTLCGGMFRTNFTDPAQGPDPCAEGHTWNEGIQTAAPRCTQEGVTTYTCTVCGETKEVPIPALGHNFGDNGVCTRCGEAAFEATFQCSEGCEVTVYPTQDLTGQGVPGATSAFARSGDLGTIDISGSGQVNFTVQLQEGYQLESVTVTPTANFKNLKGPADTGVENGYRITKISGALTVYITTEAAQSDPDPTAPGTDPTPTEPGTEPTVPVTPPAEPTKPGLPCTSDETCPGLAQFTDMPARGNWAHNPIDWAVVNQVTNGMTATTFVPEGTITRAQAVTFLWRAAGKPAPTTDKTDFTDLTEGAFYYEAVLWAVENGITKGMSPTTFVPGGSCTRGQIVTFLYRFAGSPATDAGDSPFTDLRAGAYYITSVAWAVENGITNGMSPTTFVPEGTCTRAQVVTFLYRQQVPEARIK